MSAIKAWLGQIDVFLFSASIRNYDPKLVSVEYVLIMETYEVNILTGKFYLMEEKCQANIDSSLKVRYLVISLMYCLFRFSCNFFSPKNINSKVDNYCYFWNMKSIMCSRNSFWKHTLLVFCLWSFLISTFKINSNGLASVWITAQLEKHKNSICIRPKKSNCVFNAWSDFNCPFAPKLLNTDCPTTTFLIISRSFFFLVVQNCIIQSFK